MGKSRKQWAKKVAQGSMVHVWGPRFNSRQCRTHLALLGWYWSFTALLGSIISGLFIPAGNRSVTQIYWALLVRVPKPTTNQKMVHVLRIATLM